MLLQFRNPKSEIRKKTEARTAIGTALTWTRFGLRISAFFRISGIRISEFRYRRRLWRSVWERSHRQYIKSVST